MLLLPLIPALLIGQGAAKDDKALPPADRSGEAALKKIMDAAAKLKPVHLTISVSSRGSDREVLQTEETVNIWFESPERFSVVSAGVWGDSSRYVSDGKSFLHDPFDDYQPITLKDSSPDLLDREAELRRRVDPIVYLLQGPAALDKMVRKNGTIKEIDPPGAEKGVEFESVKKGIVTIYYNENDPKKLIRRIEYDNKPWYEEQHRMYPEWWDAPEQPLTLWLIEYGSISKGFAKGVFDTKAAVGKPVIDNRKKPPLVSSGSGGL